MMLGIRPDRVGIIDMMPSLPIHSSALFVLLAGLFLVALILRANRVRVLHAAKAGLPTRRARAARALARQRQRLRRVPRDRRLDDSTAAREDAHHMMSSTKTPSPRSTSAGTVRIRWGRTLLALTAVCALLGGVGTAIASALGAMTWVAPAICGAVLLSTALALQISARIRRRRRRRQGLERAIQEAMNPTAGVSPRVTARREQAAASGAAMGISASGRPFDAMDRDAGGQGGPDSLVTHDEDGLPENPERLFGVDAAGSAPGAGDELFNQSDPSYRAPASGDAWQPRDVPQPKYLVAEKIERPEVAHQEQISEPAPHSDVKLRQPAAPVQSPSPDSADAHSPGVEEVQGDHSMDLDEVLKRRRA